MFASSSIYLMSYAVADPGRSDLLALAIGIALYGMVYFIINPEYFLGIRLGMILVEDFFWIRSNHADPGPLRFFLQKERRHEL